MQQRLDWFYLMQLADMIESLTYSDLGASPVYAGHFEVNTHTPERLRQLALKLGDYRATE